MPDLKPDPSGEGDGEDCDEVRLEAVDESRADRSRKKRARSRPLRPAHEDVRLEEEHREEKEVSTRHLPWRQRRKRQIAPQRRSLRRAKRRRETCAGEPLRLCGQNVTPMSRTRGGSASVERLRERWQWEGEGDASRRMADACSGELGASPRSARRREGIACRQAACSSRPRAHGGHPARCGAGEALPRLRCLADGNGATSARTGRCHQEPGGIRPGALLVALLCIASLREGRALAGGGLEGESRLSDAARGTRRARAEILSSAPGLPIGSHTKIASARRKWLDRSAAMEQVKKHNTTKVEAAEAVPPDYDGYGITLNTVVGGSDSARGSTWVGGLELLVRRVGAVLGLIPKRRSHLIYDSDQTVRTLHPGALVPFQVDPMWSNAALAANTETWRGYGADPAQDKSTIFSSTQFQLAILDLVNTPIGGIKLPEDAIRPWSWNTPTTGGLTMTIFGMGFGYESIRCSQQCLDAPEINANCPLKACLFLESSVGNTLGDETVWHSDSSISVVVPPGIGDNLAVNVTIGRFKSEYKLLKRFSYDAPVETRISPGNSKLAGNVTVTVFGSNFGMHNPMTTINLGESSCTTALWSSDSQVVCSKVIPGTGALLNAKVGVEGRPSENPPGISRVFSYDRPVVTAVYPGNAPAAGFSVITLLGQNFGLGPDTYSAGPSTTWLDTYAKKPTHGEELFNDELAKTLGANSGGRHEFTTSQWNAFGITGLRMDHYIKSSAQIPCPNDPSVFCDTWWVPAGKTPICPIDSPGVHSYILKPGKAREAICATGFVLPQTKRFVVPQPNLGADGEVSEGGTLQQLRWDNIRPFSLAHDPVACIINEYLCTYKGDRQYCKFIQDSCMSLTNTTVSDADRAYLAETTIPTGGTPQARPKDENNRWYAMGNQEGGCQWLPEGSKCPARVVSSYIKDGATCDMMDQTDPTNPRPYFEKHGIYTTNYLCNMSPRPQGTGKGRCSCQTGLGCCNKRGTYGARIGQKDQTECITLRWMSDSSLACRLAPGIGEGHSVMVAIDDFEGSALALKERLFSFDVPVVTDMTRGPGPVTGGKAYTLFGTDFGTFACNSSWCSFDEDLFRCNNTRCSQPGEPDSSTIFSHRASLRSTYIQSPSLRTACASLSWTSDTALACVVAPGTGDLRTVQLTVGGWRSVNRFSKDLTARQEDQSFLYNIPSMQMIAPVNLAANSGKNVTIFGRDFGLWDTTPQARMSGTACITTYWVSDTIISCTVPRGLRPGKCLGSDSDQACKAVVCNTCPNGLSSTVCNNEYDTVQGQGICRSIVVTVDRLRGYLTEAFSYEGSLITGLNPTNGPPIGSFDVTMEGESFGDNPKYGYSGKIGDTMCKNMSWYSDTAISCSMKLGIGDKHVPSLGM